MLDVYRYWLSWNGANVKTHQKHVDCTSLVRVELVWWNPSIPRSKEALCQNLIGKVAAANVGPDKGAVESSQLTHENERQTIATDHNATQRAIGL